jgi:hypothetical protein
MVRTLLPVATMALACSQLGCSFVFVKGPPAADKPVVYSEEDGFGCTESSFAPKLDIVLAGVGGWATLGALAVAMGTPSPDQTAQQRHDADVYKATMFWGGLAVAAVATISTIWGFTTTRKCREYADLPTTRRALLLQRQKALDAEMAGAEANP